MPAKKKTGSSAPKRRPRTEADLRIIHALRQLARVLDIHSRRLAAKKHVTSAQLFCMRMLATDGVDTATEVARKVHLSPSTVVGILDRLEEKDLIERRRDTRDRRVVRITLTGSGRELLERTPHPVQDLLAKQKDGLSVAEADRIADSLEDLVRLLGAEDVDATTPYGELGANDLIEKK